MSLRVLHVLNSASGGAAISTQELVRALCDAGVESAAVCHSSGAASERQAVVDAFNGRVEFRPLYWWNRKVRARAWKRPALELLQIAATGATIMSSRAVAKAAAAFRAELIHTNTILTPEGAEAAAQLGIPHVWHVRELTGPGQPFVIRGMRTRVRRRLEDAAVVVANSAATADALKACSGFSRIEVVPNAVDIRRLASMPISGDRHRLVVAMVASLESRSKKHALFLEAASRLATTSRVEFRVYGGGNENDPYVQALKRQASRLMLDSRLRWMGHVNGPENIMRDVDILVHAGDQESFGRVLVEAMAAGRPVVAPKGGGAAEIVVDGQTGILVRGDDPAEMSSAIDRLICKPAIRREFGAAGRERALRLYSVARLSRDMLDVYERAAHSIRQSTPEAIVPNT